METFFMSKNLTKGNETRETFVFLDYGNQTYSIYQDGVP